MLGHVMGRMLSTTFFPIYFTKPWANLSVGPRRGAQFFPYLFLSIYFTKEKSLLFLLNFYESPFFLP
jgi:hypothetical protein